jgi:hypothetical protein
LLGLSTCRGGGATFDATDVNSIGADAIWMVCFEVETVALVVEGTAVTDPILFGEVEFFEPRVDFGKPVAFGLLGLLLGLDALFAALFFGLLTLAFGLVDFEAEALGDVVFLLLLLLLLLLVTTTLSTTLFFGLETDLGLADLELFELLAGIKRSQPHCNPYRDEAPLYTPTNQHKHRYKSVEVLCGSHHHVVDFFRRNHIRGCQYIEADLILIGFLLCVFEIGILYIHIFYLFVSVI